ncbi:lysoplasmalogenase [Actinoplanes xinjiangensis]|uniref:lysoplasmalogenase n=1 Tax=Actinoplanes xinjiangensis TaxID=512350 RepID=UPI00344009BD
MILRLFTVVAAIEIVAVAADSTVVQWLTKPLLGPLLILYMLQRGRRDLVTVALGFATAGDIALLVPGQVAFLVGMGFFLGAQLCLITAFRPLPRPFVAAYGLLWALANLLLWERLGALAVPVLIYSLALTMMAAAAAGISRRVALGGLLFLISDLLIGLGAAGVRPPAHGVLVMTTYAAALALITTGWVRATRPA